MNLREIALALGGEIAGGQVLCPGPGHSPADRSLAVRPDPTAPDGFLCFSHCDDDWRACRDHVRGRLGIERTRSVPKRNGGKLKSQPVAIDDEARTQRVLPIWQAAQPMGAIAKSYLQHRGTALNALPNDMAHALRWHLECPWEREVRPCIVALWTDLHTAEPRAIHRRPITAEGVAVAHWRAMGPTAGCVIRLWPNDAVSQNLVIGEGVETTLAAGTRIVHRHTLLQPAWACGDAGHLAAFPVLAGIEALTVLVDHDANGAGQRAAAECAQRWKAAGREVIRLTPQKEGADFSDVVCS